MSVLRFVWKQYRFELVSVTVGVVALTAALLVVTWQLDEVRLSPACVEEWWRGSGDDVSQCRAAINAWSARRQDWMFWLLQAAPYVAGILLGSVVVSREIEHRTAQLGWSLRGSRGRWLLDRLIPVGLVLGLVLMALAAVAVFHEAARMPGIDPRLSFNEYGTSGPPLVARGVAVFAGAVLLGSIVGRQLPALILSGVLALAIGFAVSAALPFGASTAWVAEDAVVNPVADITRRPHTRRTLTARTTGCLRGTTASSGSSPASSGQRSSYGSRCGSPGLRSSRSVVRSWWSTDVDRTEGRVMSERSVSSVCTTATPFTGPVGGRAMSLHLD
jgi:hypothetical protein